MLASDITSSARKAATVLTLLGLEVQELARTLPDAPEAAPDQDEYSKLTAKLTAHFDAKVNPTFERSQPATCSCEESWRKLWSFRLPAADPSGSLPVLR